MDTHGLWAVARVIAAVRGRRHQPLTLTRALTQTLTQTLTLTLTRVQALTQALTLALNPPN